MHLLLGGARSGKSKRGVDLCNQAALASGRSKVFIATAQAFDAEMKHRIKLHQGERDASWGLIEAPLDLADALANLQANQIALVDCLTLWLSNVMLADRDVAGDSRDLLAALSQSPAQIFIVSNEVGMGLVPETPLGRAFRDAQGRLNQQVACLATIVEFVAAGLPLRLKG
jgi:adenosylcobinamide kinase / adenosylcobinamide-phosphate guanylyltransferase